MNRFSFSPLTYESLLILSTYLWITTHSVLIRFIPSSVEALVPRLTLSLPHQSRHSSPDSPSHSLINRGSLYSLRTQSLLTPSSIEALSTHSVHSRFSNLASYYHYRYLIHTQIYSYSYSYSALNLQHLFNPYPGRPKLVLCPQHLPKMHYAFDEVGFLYYCTTLYCTA